MAKNQQVDIDCKLTTMYVAVFFTEGGTPQGKHGHLYPIYCETMLLWLAHEEKEAK